MASSVFGIDLGTTYSCIAYIDENGNVQVAKNRDTGKTTTPSAVEFEDAGNVIVGEDAKARRHIQSRKGGDVRQAPHGS